MKAGNLKFYALLRELKTPGREGQRAKAYTIGILAEAVGVSPDHLNRVINNARPHEGQIFGNIGGRTRGKVARHFVDKFPTQAPLLLQSLGWDAEGNRVEQAADVPRGNRDVTYSETGNNQQPTTNNQHPMGGAA